MEPPHGLRNSSLLKAKVLRTGILSRGPSKEAGSPSFQHCLPLPAQDALSQTAETCLWIGFSSFLLHDFLFLFFHKPFSIKPKIFLFLSLKPPHALISAELGFLEAQVLMVTLLLDFSFSFFMAASFSLYFLVLPYCAIFLCLNSTMRGR